MTCLSVENGLRALLGAFLLSCTFLTTSYNTTFAFDHPLHTAALVCLLSGISLLILNRFIHRIPAISRPDKYSTIPLTEIDDSTVEVLSPVSNDDDSAKDKRTWKWWLGIGVITAIGCVRLSLYRNITENIECAPPGYAYLIPLYIAVYDFWRNQRATKKYTRPDHSPSTLLRMPFTIASRVRFLVIQSRLRYVISAALLAVSGVLVSSFDNGRESTFICPLISGEHARQRMLKILSLVFDTLVLVGAAELSGEGTRRDGRRKQTLLAWGCGLVGVALFWGAWAIHSRRTAGPDGPGTLVTSLYFGSAWSQVALITFIIVSASQLFPHYGAVGLCILAGSVVNYFELISAVFNGQESFPPIPASQALSALSLVCLGGLIFLLSRIASDDEPLFLHRLNLVSRLVFFIMFGTGLFLISKRSNVVDTHPIESLIQEAGKNHDMWLKTAKGSSNLAEAVQQYRTKYNQYPPPGFDKWYDYAVSRSSVTIDEFDDIYTNLLPFRALEPEEIRTMTQRLATNPFNGIGALSIRNGTVRLQEGIRPTHAWMVQSAGKMIEKFSEYLPDMDLAFNLDDEPRVIAPWEKVEELRRRARMQKQPPEDKISGKWSVERNATWDPMEPADQTPEAMFIERSLQRAFDPYIAPSCPPGSMARSRRVWDKRHLCMECIGPHSKGQFPTGWGIASDICHQPDLATLHGLFISPASFKITQELVPVFSQSSTSGFNDIIFPSPWNYVDKITYTPSDEHPDHKYTDKENILFWIGGTSEGVSHEGRWKGMPRQRLAHVVNNNTYNHVSVLLPADEPNTYAYQVFDGRAPTQELGLNTSVSITDPIVRCRDNDCAEQTDELHTGGRVDFQDHWQYRYLFDSDGAGFSGRFLPFLQSHSLPFKTGLFRQWFDSRITPWLHYVPIDIRLHGLWSTMAYFAGVDATVKGKKIEMKRHDTQGVLIAEEGRKWAEKALRKEDMEIYFFRLLLEWGRLTDDRRDLLGFKLPS